MGKCLSLLFRYSIHPSYCCVPEKYVDAPDVHPVITFNNAIMKRFRFGSAKAIPITIIPAFMHSLKEDILPKQCRASNLEYPTVLVNLKPVNPAELYPA